VLNPAALLVPPAPPLPLQVGAAVLDVMASLVSGKYGASFMIHQMNQNAGSGQMEMLTWRKVFSVVALYCSRFAQVRHKAPGPACPPVQPVQLQGR
jgi:hypothetical protein